MTDIPMYKAGPETRAEVVDSIEQLVDEFGALPSKEQLARELRDALEPRNTERVMQYEDVSPEEELQKSLQQITDDTAKEVEQSLLKLLADPMPKAEQSNSVPDWVKLPASGIKFPRSRTIYFMRFRAEWTDAPQKGERQCVCWNITVGDKKLAAKRAMGDGNRIMEELAMRFVRVIDGNPVDHGGTTVEGNVELWWNELGEKCRSQVMRIFMRAHALDEKEQADFLQNCIVARTAG